MAKTKAELKAEFLKLGGDPAELPEDLNNITAAEIEKKIEALEEANALKAQLEQAAAPAPQQPAASSGDKAKEPEKKQPKAASEAKEKSTKGEGISFTLVKANQFATGKLPGKIYNSRTPVIVTDPKEAEILRATGLFKEGE